MEPCEQKQNIEKLFELSSSNKDVIHDIRVVQVKIEADVAATKKTVENGLKSSVLNVELMLTGLKPLIDSHAEYIKELRDNKVLTKVEHAHTWAKRIEVTCVGAAWGICIAGTMVIVWAIANGANVLR